MNSFLKDLRFALRTLVKTPSFAAITVLTLALGIAANTAIFSVFNSLFLHPPGIGDPARVVAARVKYDKLNLKNISISLPDFADIRDSKQIFSFAAAEQDADYNYNGRELPERLMGAQITWQWFDALGAKPVLGRVFSPEEDTPGASHVVVLSHATWMRLFGGDPNIVDKAIPLNSKPYRVIGVMGADFDWPAQAQIWVPMAATPADFGTDNRFNEGFVVIARLASEVSYDRAGSYVRVLTERLIPTFSDGGSYARSSQWGMFIMPLTELVYGDLRMPMLILSATVGFVLLICCANVAGLMLARGSGRAKEVAIRAALGARRWHLVRQIMAESLLMAVAGTTLGLLLARLAVAHADAIAPTGSVNNLRIPLDRTVLLFSIAVGLLSAVLFGLAPAMAIAASRSFGLLKEGRGSGGGARQRIRSALVVSQIAIALVLLVGAGLFLKSLVRTEQLTPGFDARGVMTAALALSPQAYGDSTPTGGSETSQQKQQAFYSGMVDSLSRQPGVQAAGAVFGLPFSNVLASSSFSIEGRQQGPGDPGPHSDLVYCTPGYFRALSIPLRKGRYFDDNDRAGSTPAAIIDDTLAQAYWPGEDPVGRRVRRGSNQPWATIVGVVAHTNRSSLAADTGKGVAYYSLLQRSIPIAHVVVRASGDPATLASAIRRAVGAVDPAQVAVYDFKPLEERISESLGPRRFAVTMLITFACIALIMAAIGLYGVISYAVSQRTREIGIRMALGARMGQVLYLVLSQAMKLVAVGIGIGLTIGLLLARLLASELIQVSAFDPLTLVATVTVLAVVTLAATYIPARRASKVDPMVALRYE